MPREAEGTAGLHVLAKAQAIVRALASGQGMSAAALAARVDEPTSSVYRLLASMTALRWVERGERRGEYRLGTRFIWLGGRFESQLDLRASALPSLRLLNAETGQTAFLCIRTDDRATCIERVDGQDVQIQRLQLGGSLPLDDGATPRVLLAYSAPEFVDDYLSAPTRTDLDRHRIAGELAEIRAHGYVVADDELAAGIRSVGAPVFDHTGAIVAAVSVSGLQVRGIVDSDSTITLVLREAERISGLLGYAEQSGSDAAEVV